MPLTHYEFINKVITGNGHMWFLLMIAGMYLVVPVLRSICSINRTMEYFLSLSFLLNILLRTALETVGPLVSNPTVKTLLDSFYTDYKAMGIDVVLGYSFYFVLGYYLSTREQSRTLQAVMYIGSVIGFASTFVATHLSALHLGYKYMGFYGDLTLNVMLQSVGVFVLIKSIRWNISKGMTKGILALSTWSFGIYLVHELVIGKFASFGITPGLFNPLLSIPVISVGVFLFSAIISMILNHIPVLRKYLV